MQVLQIQINTLHVLLRFTTSPASYVFCYNITPFVFQATGTFLFSYVSSLSFGGLVLFHPQLVSTHFYKLFFSFYF